MATRLTLTIPSSSYEHLTQMAAREETSIAELLRKAAKLLVFVRSLKDDPDARLLVERGGEIQEIVLDFI